jgi:hypothetical protein
MSQNPFDPFWKAKVTVPVKKVGGAWEFFYGGDVPIEEGALGELTIDADQITDERFKKRVLQETVVKVLNEGDTLMVALSDRLSTLGRNDGAPVRIPYERLPMGVSRLVPIVLGPASGGHRQASLNDENPLAGGLWLRLRGLEKTELISSTVLLPKTVPEPKALSLNHAYTLLSKVYETHRISNTGNVYSRIFYQDADEEWYPLDDLRCGVKVGAERKLMMDVWQQVESTLGWRLPPVAPRIGRKSSGRAG